MQFKQAYFISAPRQDVWRALNDADLLAEIIPGCRHVKWVSDTSLETEIAVNLGVAHPSLKGELILSDINPAVSYTLTGRGKGGIFGRAEGSADITLADEGDGTLLEFIAHGAASGQIARFGGALLGAQAEKIIDGFFARFGKAMGAEITPRHDKQNENTSP